jgi:hypothetical protein
MHVISSFDHSIYVELAITALIEEGISKHQIMAISLDNNKRQPKLFDTIHHSDGYSLLDTGSACATALAVIGSSYGFVLKGGPIMWGCTGAVVGFLIGFTIDILLKKRDKKPNMKNKISEVVILVDCSREEAVIVETVLWNHYALGVGKVGGGRDTG